MDVLLLVVGMLLGAGLGIALGWSLGRARVLTAEAERALLRERLAVADSAATDRQEFAVSVAPLREALGKVESHLRELEAARISAYAGLTEQVSRVRLTSEALGEQTRALVTALRAPQARGRWGEMQLRRVVEMAGMVEHCDFSEQHSVTRDGVLLRPDLVVQLAGGKQVVVDAKVSLAAYLDAVESRDPDVVADRMVAHARHLREHVRSLASKQYWRDLEPTPEFVVLFVPGEAFLAPAFEQDPGLLEYAMTERVLIATPTTLMAMLRTIAYAWQQEALTENARTVFELGRELYRRLGTLGGHVDKLGKTLGRAVEDYNKTVGSLERTVLVQARKMADLKVTDTEVPELAPVDAAVRPLGAPELLQYVAELDPVRPAPSVAEQHPVRRVPPAAEQDPVRPVPSLAEQDPVRAVPSVAELVAGAEVQPPDRGRRHGQLRDAQ